MEADILTPLVSIVVPTYNQAELLEKTLLSAIRQSWSTHEILVVDDASTDHTRYVVERFSSGLPNVRYIRRSENSNLPAVSRNVGIAEARGKYCAFLDHDDLWIKRKLERQIPLLETHSKYLACFAFMMSFGSGVARSLRSIPSARDRSATTRNLRDGNMIACSSMVVRTDVLRKLGGFSEDPNLRAVEDFHLWYRIAQSGTIAYVPELVGFYREIVTGTLARENLQARHKYLDELLETRLSRQDLSSGGIRALDRSIRYPLDFYIHLVESRLRQFFRTPPRVVI